MTRKKILSYYLYLSFHIGLCGAALTLFSFLSLGLYPDWIYITFMGTSTTTLYNLHRIIGLQKATQKNTRFEIISTLTKPLIFFSIVGILISGICYFNFNFTRQLLLIFPCVLSLTYILPIFPGKKRFRDLPFAKAILLALSWALLTITLPYVESHETNSILGYLTLERFFFIFAMGLPFDIRDIHIDQSAKVRTIPNTLGIKKTQMISGILLLIASIIAFTIYPSTFAISLIFTYLLGWLMVQKSSLSSSDFYYAFVVDLVVGIPIIIYGIFYCFTN